MRLLRRGVSPRQGICTSRPVIALFCRTEFLKGEINDGILLSYNLESILATLIHLLEINESDLDRFLWYWSNVFPLSELFKRCIRSVLLHCAHFSYPVPLNVYLYDQSIWVDLLEVIDVPSGFVTHFYFKLRSDYFTNFDKSIALGSTEVFLSLVKSSQFGNKVIGVNLCYPLMR